MIIKNLYLIVAPLLLSTLLFTTVGCGTDTSDNSSKAKPVDINTKTQSDLEPVFSKEPDIAKGKIVYEFHCHYCHGRRGRGKGPVSIAVKPNPADFISDKKRMAVTDEALFKSVSYGITKESGGQKLKKALAMPPFAGVLTPEERWNVIAYIRELVSISKNKEKKK